jgi:immunity protein, SdpI family
VNRKPAVFASALLIAFMAALSLWAWPQIPAGRQIPIHWNAAGNPDGYASKELALLVLPIVALAIALLLAAIPQLEPRRLNLAQSAKPYLTGWIGGLVVLAGAHLLIVLAAVGHPANIVTIASLLVGGLLIVVGNYLGKARSNFFFGIRTPWTLSSDLSWDKTNRLGGRVFVAVGAAWILAGLTRSGTVFAVVLVILLALIVIVTIYSYFVWRDDPLKHPLGR